MILPNPRCQLRWLFIFINFLGSNGRAISWLWGHGEMRGSPRWRAEAGPVDRACNPRSRDGAIRDGTGDFFIFPGLAGRRGGEVGLGRWLPVL